MTFYNANTLIYAHFGHSLSMLMCKFSSHFLQQTNKLWKPWEACSPLTCSAHTLSHALVHAHTVGLKVNNLLMGEKTVGGIFLFTLSFSRSLTHLRQGSAVTYEVGQLSLSGQRTVHNSCANPSVSTSYGRVSRHFPGYGAPSRRELH